MSKSSKDKGGKGKGNELMAQMGFDMSQFDPTAGGMPEDDVDNDDDLEAELLRLQGGQPQTRSKSPRPAPKNPVDLSNIENMAEACMQDIPDDLSDEDDPELLAELNDIAEDSETSAVPASQPSLPAEKTSPAASSPQPKLQSLSPNDTVSVLEERLANYKTATSNAKANGETGKARRYERGIKTLEGFLKTAKAGREVNQDDIPPQVATGSVDQTAGVAMGTSHSSISPNIPDVSALAASNVPSSSTQSNIDPGKMKILVARKDEYKMAAFQAKNAGDRNQAMEYMKVVKQFEHVITAYESGQEVDVSQMPPPPSDKANTTTVKADIEMAEDLPVPSAEEAKEMFKAPEAPQTIMEALQQRLDKFKSTMDSSKAENNNSKARRMGRIVKQYEDAVKAYKAGKAVDFQDLPTPPGYGPIPMENIAASQQKAGSASNLSVRSTGSADSLPVPHTSPSRSPVSPKVPSQKSPSPGSANVKRSRTSSLQEKQLNFLQERQKLFRQAALGAKNRGDVELAKKYLRNAKGFDPMIEACEAGLPIDLTRIPQPPGVDGTSIEILQMSGEEMNELGDRDQQYKTLESTLIEQIRTCSSNSQHFTSLGDVSTAARFDKNCQDCRKDLETLKNAYKHGDPVPRFHYENRTYSMVQYCSELGDGDLEINIIRGLHYGLPSSCAPKDLDTYVKSELGFPNDSPQKNESNTVKGTENPEYNSTFKLQVNRKSRAFLRFVKIKTIKFEVFYKRGFLKSDKQLGTVNVKLAPLETKCVVHESYDLMDGRKTVGGKLEIKLRIREPFVTKQVEEVKEKWLVIDEFVRALKPPAPQAPSKSPSRSPNARRSAPQILSPQHQVAVTSSGGSKMTSNAVLKFEIQQLQYQLSKYARQLNETQLKTMNTKIKLLQTTLMQQQTSLKSREDFINYLQNVEPSIEYYESEARNFAQKDQRDKAQTSMKKKKLASEEVHAIKSKLGVR